MANSDYYIADNSDIEIKKLEAAKGLYLSGNYSGALKLYLDLVNTSFSHKLAYEIGRCYYKLEDFDNAESYFSKSITLSEVKNPALVFLGNVYHKKQNLEKAIEFWITSYSYKPDDESVCLNLASSYFSKEMKFQSIYFYQRFLKYAKDKTTPYYQEIKKSIDEFEKIGNDFYQKALRSISMKDNETAIQSLEYSVKNNPLNFDANYRLGKLYLESQKYIQALIYLKQAYSIDMRSLDVLEMLSTVMLHLGDFTGAYCCFKRILPLVINNQKEYLEIMKTVRELESSFDRNSYQGHKEWADNYFNDNNYQFALFEYENCLIINASLTSSISSKIEKIKAFLNPEERIIKTCFEKGANLYSMGDYRQSNKYFTKIMSLSKEDSADYKLAKSRIMNNV